MTIKEQVEAGIKAALKARDQERLSALRMINAELLLKQKESGKSLDDPTADAALRAMLKKYHKAKDEYETLGKSDEVEHYARDMEIIESFMSAPMMNEDQIRQALAQLVTQMDVTGPKDFGRVMKTFISEHADADGRTVSSSLREILDKKQA